MTWQLNSFSLIFFLATAIAGVLLIYAMQHRNVKGAGFFVFLMASVIAWVLFQALEYAVLEPENKILFTKFQYFGISTIGLTWYLFSVNYSNRENWFSKNYPVLSVFAILGIILAFTNDAHRLVWPEIIPASPEPGAPMIYVHGPAFWMIFTYIYVLFAAGTFVIIRTALTSKEIYRSQVVGLIASALIPWVGNIIYVTGLSPIAGLDFTSLGFVLSTLVIAWTLFSLRLFDLAPVARDQLMENLVDGVIVLDTYNRVIEINPQARIFLGIENKFAVGRSIVDFLQPWPSLVERFRTVQSEQAEIHLGGHEFSDIDVRISPLLNNQKTLAGRIITIRDISEQKKMERTRENLTRSIVHDLRNPLISLTLSLENLRRQAASLPKPQLDTIDTSRQGVQQMLDLVDSILDIYRLEKGEMPIHRKRVSLALIASEATRAMTSLASRKRILIQVDIPEGMPQVEVDPNLMRRVIQNLLDHLVKGMSEGRIVRIQAGFEHGEKAVVFSTFDLGGAEAVREDLFEKSRPGNEKFTESDLGLAFCRLVVEAHGGRIWVDDRYKNGTKFSLTIPEVDHD